MVTRDTAINYVRNYLNECVKNNIKIDQAILFGSYAKGEEREYSDIDVALVSKKFSENPIENWKMLAPVNIKFLDIEPHAFTYDYFLEGDPFIDEIKKTGIEIPV